MRPSAPPRSRRRFLRGGLALAGLCVLSGCGQAPLPWRQSARIPRVGWLGAGSADEAEPFLQGLQDLGYREGRSVTHGWRHAEGELGRLPEFAAELVRLPVDVLVASGTAAVRAAKDATGTIPIVMGLASDPVGNGFVASLARPGGNVTGLATLSSVLVIKRLEILREALPGAARMAVLWNPAIPDRTREFADVEAAARGLGLAVLSVEVRNADELRRALGPSPRDSADVLFLIDNAVLDVRRAQVADFALGNGLPLLSTNRHFAEGGGLLSYGYSRPDLSRRAAAFVDKILKGAKPADLPVEQPSKFDFVINLKTARALGLSIPPSVLQQATEVIQ